MRHVLRPASLMAAAVLALGPAASAADDFWLHVSVEETGGAQVKVNLPMALVEKAVDMIPEDHLHHGRVRFDETEWTLEELRALWNEVVASPDMTFVTVEEADESVRVWKEGDFLLARVREEGEGTVDVRIPTPVVEALLSGDGESFDVASALEALAAHGGGELVTVAGDDERVRVWIDRQAEPAS